MSVNIFYKFLMILGLRKSTNLKSEETPPPSRYKFMDILMRRIVRSRETELVSGENNNRNSSEKRGFGSGKVKLANKLFEKVRRDGPYFYAGPPQNSDSTNSKEKNGEGGSSSGESSSVIEVNEINFQEGLDFSRNAHLEKALDKYKENLEFSKSLKAFLSWIYTLTLLLVLFLQPCYSFAHKVNSDIVEYGPGLSFDLIYPVQYIYLLSYFGKDHFDTYFINKDSGLCIPNPDNKLQWVMILSGILCATSLVYYALALLTNLWDDTTFYPHFEEEPNSQRITVLTIFAVAVVVGRASFFIHVALFIMVFRQHCETMRKFIKKIRKDDKGDLSINELSVTILDMKHELKISIDHFKNFFSALTLLGAVSFGFMVERFKEYDLEGLPWISMTLYILFQGLFMMIINKLDDYKDEVVGYIRSAKFVKRYLSRTTLKGESFQDNVKFITLGIAEENSTTLDWLVINDVLSEGWSQFTVLGIPVNDGTLIKRGIALVTLIISFSSYIK